MKTNNSVESPRFTAYVKKVRAAASGMGESVPSDGGFLLGREMVAGLTSQIYTGRLSELCTRMTIGSFGCTVPMLDERSRVDGSRAGGVEAFWRDEGAAITESNPQFRAVELNLRKLTAMLTLTDETWEDALGLEAMLVATLGNEFGFKLDDAILRRDGATRPLGILNCGALITVPKAGGQANYTILAANVLAMYERMWAGGHRGAVWIANSEIASQLMSIQLTGAGGTPAFVFGNRDKGELDTLLGHPVYWTEQASVIGDVGDLTFADMGQYLLAQRGETEIASSIHVEFLTDQSKLRFILRVDGQPLWSAPLVPYKGASSRSPFVTLAARKP
ncbi:MAG: phage major capsid protein [Rectinemataceae bacterium]